MTTHQNEIKKICDRLDKSIVYQMSLNSHELFHSNLWAWLMEKDDGFIGVFFPELKGIDCEIKREEENRDVTVWANSKAYVIENKFKSIPTEAQLVGYEEKLNQKNKFAKGILTGIIKPAINVGARPLSKWSFLSYEEIVTRMENYLSFGQTRLDEQTTSVIQQYTAMVRDLCYIVKSDLESNPNHVSQLSPPSSEDEDIRKIRIRDLLIKIHADAFCAELRHDPEYKSFNDSLPSDCHLIIEPGFSNKNGLIDVYIQHDKENNHSAFDLRIGVQIQEGQFRIDVVKEKQYGTKSAYKIFEDYRGLGWFEEYNRNIRKFKGKNSSMKPRKENGYQYNKYDGANYSFIYQYFNIPEKWNDEDAKKEILSYLNQAKGIINY